MNHTQAMSDGTRHATAVAAVKYDHDILEVLCKLSASIRFSLLFMTQVRPEGQSRSQICDSIFASAYLLADPKVFRRPPDGLWSPDEAMKNNKIL